MTAQRLYAVPKPEFVESPTSWLFRVASSQAVSMWQMGRFLGFRMSRDCDEQILTLEPGHLARMSGQTGNEFEDVGRMLKLALALRMESPVLLHENGLPRYRFCVECLVRMRTPYLPIYWRMDVYRMCTIHQCLLEDHCPHCGVMVCPQSRMGPSGVARPDVSMLSQCLACTGFLWDVAPIKTKAISRRRLSKGDRTRLLNGGVFVSALFHGKVELPGDDSPDVQSALERAARLGMFASHLDLTAKSIRAEGAEQIKRPSVMTESCQNLLVPSR